MALPHLHTPGQAHRAGVVSCCLCHQADKPWFGCRLRFVSFARMRRLALYGRPIALGAALLSQGMHPPSLTPLTWPPWPRPNSPAVIGRFVARDYPKAICWPAPATPATRCLWSNPAACACIWRGNPRTQPELSNRATSTPPTPQPMCKYVSPCTLVHPHRRLCPPAGQRPDHHPGDDAACSAACCAMR